MWLQNYLAKTCRVHVQHDSFKYNCDLQPVSSLLHLKPVNEQRHKVILVHFLRRPSNQSKTYREPELETTWKEFCIVCICQS